MISRKFAKIPPHLKHISTPQTTNSCTNTLLRIFLRTDLSARSSSLVSGRSVGRVIPSLANKDFSSAESTSCLNEHTLLSNSITS